MQRFIKQGRVKTINCLALCAMSIFLSPHSSVSAQEAGDAGLLPPGAAPANPGVAAVQILEVGDNNLASLQGLATQGRAHAVSLGASLAAVQSNSAAANALAGWVRDGGVVLLHTDAAQLFGFQTVAARIGNPRSAGQLYGRAKAALPFGVHPLLWSGTPAATPTANALPADGATLQDLPTLGVQTVYYQLEQGDHLVVSHPAATPLLRVTDLAAFNEQPLYASAIAPFGKGWAIVVPRLVEQQRADGAAFMRNLMSFITGSRPAAPTGGNATEQFVALPSTLIEQAVQVAAGNAGYAALIPEWNKAIAQPAPAAFSNPEELAQPETVQRVMLNATEANAAVAALGSAAQGGDAARFRILAYILSARLEMLRGDLAAARTALESANEISSNVAELLLWQGVWGVASSQNIQLDSPTRGRLLAAAVTNWNAVTSAPSLAITGNAQATAASTISGVTAAQLQNWISAATRAGELALVEPPLVTPIGGPNKVILLRHFPEDPTLRMALPAGALLGRADNLLGWGVDAEEILIFPNDQYYTAYSQAARIGSRQVAFSPLADRGNAIGERILMVSQITVPVLLDPGPPPRFAQLGAAVPAIIGRLHAQVLVNALTQDGGNAPEWMQLGLMSIANIAVSDTSLDNQALPEALMQRAVTNTLLGPEQFRGVNLGTDREGAVEAQARRLMLFFYEAFGPGAVVETMQRIGAGQDVNEALVATTELDENAFFQAWYQAEFGNRVPVLNR